MGVRTRPGIKHDHGHNQQWEALAEQHRDGTGAALQRGQNGPGAAPAASPAPGTAGAWPGPSPCMDSGLWPVPGAAVSSRMQRSGSPRLTRPRCPGTGQPVPLVWWPCRVVVLSPMGAPKIMAFSFSFFYGFFAFFLFLAANLPLQVLWRKQGCAQGVLPWQPLHTGVRAEELLCRRDCGQEPDLGPPAQPNPSNLGSWTPRHPPEPSHGAWVRVPGEGQRTGTAQCLCEHEVVAWDGAAGDERGETRILQNEDKVELSSRACGGRGRVSADIRGAGAAAGGGC